MHPLFTPDDPGDPAAGQAQDRANAPFAPVAPPSKGSKSKMPRTTASGKRPSKSLSTPQLRGSIMSESDADKKRNRLGYQRITIACGCVPSEDESEPRCSNCIRLKKECIYYPVDQQIALDAQSESSGRTTVPSTASSTVSSSPPHLGARALPQHGQHLGSQQSLHVDSQSNMRGVPIAPSISPAPPGSFSAPIPQRSQFGPDTYAPSILAYGPPQHGWEMHNIANHHHQYSHVPVGNAVGMQPTYPAYNNPALQADTAPFPDPPELHQTLPANRDDRMYIQPPALPPQQWPRQQQEQMSFYPHYQQHSVYNGPIPQEQQPMGYYTNQSDPQFAGMPPGHAPPPVQHSQYLMQPGHGAQYSAGHYLPMQQVPGPLRHGPSPYAPADDGTHERHSGRHASGPG